MHILQTQKLNPGVNAGTDQLLTIMQQGTWNGSAGPRNPTVPAGGWKTRTLNPYILPKKMQRKWQAPSDEKLTNRIKTDSSHTVKGQKEKGKRSIWSETTILIVSCWPFHWTPVQDAWGQASAPARGHLQVADRPRLGHSSHPEVPQQESGRPGLASKCPGSIRSPGLAEGQRTPPRAPELFAQAPSLPLYPRPTLGLCGIFETHLPGRCWIWKCVSCLVTSHTVWAILARPLLTPNRVPPPWPWVPAILSDENKGP